MSGNYSAQGFNYTPQQQANPYMAPAQTQSFNFGLQQPMSTMAYSNLFGQAPQIQQQVAQQPNFVRPQANEAQQVVESVEQGGK